MFNIHDWILLIQRGLNLLEGFVCLESVPCSSWDELQMKECRRMLASMLGMHVAILFLSFVVVLIVVQTLK